MNTQHYKDILLKKAQERFKEYQIFPSGQKQSLDECITFEAGNCYLWFNTSMDCSTRVVSIPLE